MAPRIDLGGHQRVPWLGKVSMAPRIGLDGIEGYYGKWVSSG